MQSSVVEPVPIIFVCRRRLKLTGSDKNLNLQVVVNLHIYKLKILIENSSIIWDWRQGWSIPTEFLLSLQYLYKQEGIKKFKNLTISN